MILKGLKSRFEEHHEVKYTTQSLRKAAELSARYINDRHLPDKAIDVIHEAGGKNPNPPGKKGQKTLRMTYSQANVVQLGRQTPSTRSTPTKR